MVSTVRIPSGFITNPARDDPADFHFKASGQSHVLAFKKGGDWADVIVFGFVTKSELVEGRTYNSSGTSRRLKNIEVNVIAQEGERLLAMLSMASGGKPMNLTNTENGAFSFATKHTAVDEYGGEIKSAYYTAAADPIN